MHSPLSTAIIQARMSSSRLPGKVLREIGAANSAARQPMLAHVVERAKQARLVQQVIVATTTDPSDDAIERLCAERGYPCYRGSLPDVLDRYYQAARQHQAETIVRITADCPLLDPAVVDLTIRAFLDGYDFAANRLPPPWTRSLPIGLDTEVCSFAALERAWKEADQPFHREHVMPYLYEGVSLSPSPTPPPSISPSYHVTHGVSPRGFRIAQLHHSPDYGALRWTVDTPADLELVQQIFAHLTADKKPAAAGQTDPALAWQTVLKLFQRHPELADINADIQHKTVFDVDTRT
jgi:spore coat polysaccharide biosynthesis protein SpsF